MAEPVSPVIPGHDFPEIVFAKDQPDYAPLPAIRMDDGTVITRWYMSEEERQRIAATGEVWLMMKTFRQPLQPVYLTGLCPRITDEQGQPQIELL